MKLVEQHIFKKGSKRFSTFDEICFLSKNLYNYSLYLIRKEFEETGKWKRYNELEKLLRTSNQIDYISLPPNSSQQILMVLDRSFTSFFKTLNSWKKDQTKFKAIPQIPSFKDKIKGRNIVIFTSNQFRLREGKILFPKRSGLEPITTKLTHEQKLNQVRIIPRFDYYVIEIIYEFQSKEKDLTNKNYLSIDLGLNNLATCTTNIGLRPFIINGRPIKSINQYYNKKLAKLKSCLEKQNKKQSSRATRRLTNKRNRKIKDYMHKSTKHIVDYCVKNDIGNIVIGKNEGWKQGIELGSKTNQNFVQIPFNLFESFLSYKSEKFGVNFVSREESYTSKCSVLDLEKVGKQVSYLGRRKSRGLFYSSRNIRINADINGSYNILRKEVGDEFLVKQGILLDRGLVVSPMKINFH